MAARASAGHLRGDRTGGADQLRERAQRQPPAGQDAPGVCHHDAPAPTPAPTVTATSAPVPTTTPMPGGTPAPTFPWPSGAPTVGPGQVEFGLLVTGTPVPGEELDVYFQAPQAGQNEFQLCGAVNPCRPEPGQVYTWSAQNVPAGASPWAFQERLGATTTTIKSGTLDATHGAVITATVPS